jgi:hypothetical protein
VQRASTSRSAKKRRKAARRQQAANADALQDVHEQIGSDGSDDEEDGINFQQSVYDQAREELQRAREEQELAEEQEARRAQVCHVHLIGS